MVAGIVKDTDMVNNTGTVNATDMINNAGISYSFCSSLFSSVGDQHSC